MRSASSRAPRCTAPQASRWGSSQRSAWLQLARAQIRAGARSGAALWRAARILQPLALLAVLLPGSWMAGTAMLVQLRCRPLRMVAAAPLECVGQATSAAMPAKQRSALTKWQDSWSSSPRRFAATWAQRTQLLSLTTHSPFMQVRTPLVFSLLFFADQHNATATSMSSPRCY